MVRANHKGIEKHRRGHQRIDCRIEGLGGEITREHDDAVHVTGNRRDGGIGEIVGGNIDRLYRRDRGPRNGSNSLLQEGHLGRKRGLISNARGKPAQKTRKLGASLNEAKHVVHEKQHILMLLIAEIFGDSQRS